MNILLLSRYFPPDIGTAANLFHELARGLTGKGHDVTVVTGYPWYNLKVIPEKYRTGLSMTEVQDGIRIVRVRFPHFGPKPMKLLLGYAGEPLFALFGGLFLAKKPDIVFVYSPPLPLGVTAWMLTRLWGGVPFVLGVQDLHPQCYIDQGILKNRLAISMLEGLEKFCYRTASRITVHSKGNKDHMVQRKSVPEEKVTIVPNWLDTDEMKPLPRENEFSKEHGLDGKFIVGYAGTLGMSQGLMSLIETAALLKNEEGIEFFIVGDGLEKEKMVARAQELGLSNIRFLGMQPKSLYPLVVAASDVGLVTLNRQVKTPVVPSKILSIMAAARPVLASMPLDGDAPKIIEEAGCGICIEPENPAALAEKILSLARDRELCARYGQKGRDYVVRHFSLGKIIGDIETMLSLTITNKKKVHVHE
jgi:colanic acid biosynthesis glycosyl transferase WcaI